MEPVLSAVCNEKGKEIERFVYPCILTLDNLKSFWERAKKFDTLFTYELKNDFARFCSIFVSQPSEDTLEGRGVIWVVDDFVGVFYLTRIDAPHDALAHFSFFDGRVNGRFPLAQAMLKYVFNRYNFVRLSAEVPYYAVPAAHFFAKNIGFKQEGRKRRCAEYHNELFDVALYGMLREECK